MTIAHEFAYLQPGSLAEALAMLGDNRDAWVLAGGTDLVPWLRDDAVFPEVVVDIKRIEGLAGIAVEDGVLRIGALATFSDLLRSDIIAAGAPLLAEAAGTVASVGIRNRATLIGNICSAVPSCDGGPALLVYEASVVLAGPDGERTVAIDEWFRAPRRSAIRAGEIATGLRIPLPGEHGGCYVKLSRYRGEDLAQAGVAVVARPGHGYRVAFGAVGPTPFRAPAIEAHLDGHPIGDEVLGGLDDLVDAAISPITDVRATREYRAHMCRVMLRRGLAAAVARLEGGGPPYGESVI